MSISKWLWGSAVCACVIGFASIVAANVNHADENALVVRQGTAHQALFAVAFEGKHGVAVGTAGELLASSDAGASWQSQAVPTNASLLGVAVRDGHAVAVGQSGAVLLRDTQGHWEAATSGTTERLLGVDLDGRGSVVAVGAFGKIVRSGDGGKQWTAIAPDWTQGYTDQGMEPHLYDVALTPDHRILVAGEFGLVIESSDEGATWSVRRKGNASLFAIDLGADGVGYAVGQDGTVTRTRDAGATWTDVALNSTANLLDVRRLSNGRIVIAAMRDMFESDDGNAWRRVDWGDFASGWYAGIASPSGSEAGQALVVGHSGRIVQLRR